MLARVPQGAGSMALTVNKRRLIAIMLDKANSDFAIAKTFTVADWRLICVACAQFKPGTTKAAEGKERLTEIAHELATMTGKFSGRNP